jgi:hypothetical protein
MKLNPSKAILLILITIVWFLFIEVIQQRKRAESFKTIGKLAVQRIKTLCEEVEDLQISRILRATNNGFIYRVEEQNWKVINGGDFNILIDKLQERGFSNTVLQMEKNGHLFNVEIPDRTNATIRYIGKKL